MNLSKEELLDVLRKKFNIVGEIDLLDCERNQSLYANIAAYTNRVFEKNERLLVIADKHLAKTFDDSPANILSTLQIYIRDCNIPHFFIIILSNIDTIKIDLNYLHNKFYFQETEPISTIFNYI